MNIEDIKHHIAISCHRDDSIQNVHTPYGLCNEVVDKLFQSIDSIKEDKILVLFNLEFVVVLIEQGVKPENIVFLSDSRQRKMIAEKLKVEVYGFNPFDLIKKERNIIMKKQFDIDFEYLLKE